MTIEHWLDHELSQATAQLTHLKSVITEHAHGSLIGIRASLATIETVLDGVVDDGHPFAREMKRKLQYMYTDIERFVVGEHPADNGQVTDSVPEILKPS